MTKLKLTKIGTSTGAVLPREMLEAKEGYLITPYDPAIADQLDAAVSS